MVQAAVGILDVDTDETLAARVLALEHRIYPAALKLLAENRTRIVDGRCLIDGIDSSASALIAPHIPVPE